MKYLLLTALLFVPVATDDLPAPADESKQTPVLINDPEFQNVARAAIDSLYNRNAAAARELISPWAEKHPDHPLWLLWDAMEYWWLVLTDLYDDSHDEALFAKMEKSDAGAVRLLREDANHPDAYIIRAVANGYIARLHANRQRWVRSIRTARTAMKAHEDLGSAAPGLSDNLFAEGLKKYYSAWLPEAYPVVRAVSWLLPSGDKEEGLRLLELTSDDAVFARPEAVYFLGSILLNNEQEYERALVHIRSLVDAYPNNSFYRRLLVRTLFQQRKDAVAEQEIAAALRHWDESGFDDRAVLREELLYWRGRILLFSGRDAPAMAAFEESHRAGRALPNRSRRSFHALSGYYAGFTAERLGDVDTARGYYRSVVALDCEPETRDRARKRISQL